MYWTKYFCIDEVFLFCFFGLMSYIVHQKTTINLMVSRDSQFEGIWTNLWLYLVTVTYHFTAELKPIIVIKNIVLCFTCNVYRYSGD